MLRYLTALFVLFWQWNNQRRWRPAFWGRRLRKGRQLFLRKKCTPRENLGYAYAPSALSFSGRNVKFCLHPWLRVTWFENFSGLKMTWLLYCSGTATVSECSSYDLCHPELCPPKDSTTRAVLEENSHSRGAASRTLHIFFCMGTSYHSIFHEVQLFVQPHVWYLCLWQKFGAAMSILGARFPEQWWWNFNCHLSQGKGFFSGKSLTTKILPIFSWLENEQVRSE